MVGPLYRIIETDCVHFSNLDNLLVSLKKPQYSVHLEPQVVVFVCEYRSRYQDKKHLITDP